MATTLTTETLRLPGARLGPESSVPPVARMRNLQQTARADVDEDDGLFLGCLLYTSPSPRDRG